MIPSLYVINNTGMLIPDLDNSFSDEINLVYVKCLDDVPDRSLSLYITDDKSVIKHIDDSRFVYYVYAGFDDIKMTEDPYVLADVDPVNGCLQFSRWVRSILRDYEAWTYKNLLQTIIDSSPNMVWVKDIDERHVILNKTFCDVVNKPHDFCIGKKHPDIWDISWEEYESSDFACRQSEKEVMESGSLVVSQEPVSSHGKLRQFTTYKAPIYDYFHNIIGTCGIGHDVTDISLLGRELDIFMSAFSNPLFLCDVDYNIQRMNAAARSLVNVQGTSIDNYKVWKKFFLTKEPRVRTGEGKTYIYRSGSAVLYYAVVEQKVKDFFGNVTGRLCVLRDVTYQCMYDDLMFQAANIDVLTGAYNRRFFYKELESHKGKPVALLYLDLNNFKRINDVLGHMKGDSVLSDVVRILRMIFPDDCIARLGGDEFAVILPYSVSGSDYDDKFERIRNNVASLVDSGMDFGVAIGFFAEDHLTDVESFIKSCDEKMYDDKKRVKSRSSV